MGKALADEALRRGLEVEFISGPVPDGNLPNLRKPVIRVSSAEEMLEAAQQKFGEADIILFAAAVADFQPAEKNGEKIPKSGHPITVKLIPTPDIAATLCKNKRSDQIAVGFALQTHDGEANARRKLISKHLNGILLNTPATLGAETGTFTWISRSPLPSNDLRTELWGFINKVTCSHQLFEWLVRDPDK